MPQERSAGKPTTRWHSEQEKAAAVQMARTLRAETGSEHGTVKRVADQLGYGVEVGAALGAPGRHRRRSRARRDQLRGSAGAGRAAHGSRGCGVTATPARAPLGPRYRLEGAVHDARDHPDRRERRTSRTRRPVDEREQQALRADPLPPATCAVSAARGHPGQRRASSIGARAINGLPGDASYPGRSHLLRTVTPHDRTKEMRPQRQDSIHGLRVGDKRSRSDDNGRRPRRSHRRPRPDGHGEG